MGDILSREEIEEILKNPNKLNIFEDIDLSEEDIDSLEENLGTDLEVKIFDITKQIGYDCKVIMITKSDQNGHFIATVHKELYNSVSTTYVGRYTNFDGTSWEFKTYQEQNTGTTAINILKESAKQYFKLKKEMEENKNG